MLKPVLGKMEQQTNLDVCSSEDCFSIRRKAMEVYSYIGTK